MRRGGPLQPRPRRIPVRTCVACRSERGKRELVRIVRGADGSVRIDAAGKTAGRGAYLCARSECWDASFRRDSLVQALKLDAIPVDDLVRLREFAATLSPVDSASSPPLTDNPIPLS